MFGNRSFLVKMVKDKETPITDTVEESEPIDLSGIVDALGRNAVGVILIYFSADTVRQVLIHAAKVRIT
jgi:hypothetical protein